MAKPKVPGYTSSKRSKRSSFRTVGGLSGGKAPLYMHGLEDIYDVADKTEAINHTVNDIRNHFIKWFGQEDGGLFSYTVAKELAQYIKSELLRNEDIPIIRTPLDPWWKDVKADYHPGSVDKLGVASGKLANSIVAKKWSGKSGRWMVTVEGTYPAIPGYQGGGNIRDVGVVGSLLEFGMEGFDGSGEALHMSGAKGPKKQLSSSLRKVAPETKKEAHVQPPRPWFYPAFVKFVEEKFPDLTDKIFLNKYNKYFRRLAKQTTPSGDANLNIFAVKAEDIVDVSSDYDPEEEMSEAASVMQETTRQGVGESAWSRTGASMEGPSVGMTEGVFNPEDRFFESGTALIDSSTREFWQLETAGQVKDFLYQIQESLGDEDKIQEIKDLWKDYKM